MIRRKNVTASEPTRLPAAVTASDETVHRIAVANAASSPRWECMGRQGLGISDHPSVFNTGRRPLLRRHPLPRLRWRR